jgi:broad specificity phosphatase PhoE
LTREILLVRHGRPLCDERTPIRGADFGAWARAYDDAPLDAGVEPPASLRRRVEPFDCIVTSSLRRSRESAHLLTGGRTSLSDAVFDEAGVPTALALRLRLPPGYWDVAVRVAWLCGWSGGAESMRAATARARLGAARLATLAAEHGRVVLVGHGMMNRLLSRELQRTGWVGRKPPIVYWGSAILTSKSREGRR